MTTEKFLKLVNDEDFRQIFRQMDENRKTIDEKISLSQFLKEQRRKTLEIASDYKNKLMDYIKIIVDTKADKDTKALALMGLSNRKNVYSAAEFVDSDIYTNLIQVAEVYDASPMLVS